MFLLTFRVLQACWHLFTGKIDTIIASHEVEEMVEEASAHADRES
jgi:TRAP-type C4-dicarboxylate transport system permease small subunit